MALAEEVPVGVEHRALPAAEVDHCPAGEPPVRGSPQANTWRSHRAGIGGRARGERDAGRDCAAGTDVRGLCLLEVLDPPLVQRRVAARHRPARGVRAEGASVVVPGGVVVVPAGAPLGSEAEALVHAVSCAEDDVNPHQRGVHCGEAWRERELPVGALLAVALHAVQRQPSAVVPARPRSNRHPDDVLGLRVEVCPAALHGHGAVRGAHGEGVRSLDQGH
mmetsp:Transcript_16847/g.63909  ORF Transcript_16847/g.63909 Transcript_16847/m.63909 type:complete len:221 (-) Transcript_16847:5817-6479(-)